MPACPFKTLVQRSSESRHAQQTKTITSKPDQKMMERWRPGFTGQGWRLGRERKERGREAGGRSNRWRLSWFGGWGRVRGDAGRAAIPSGLNGFLSVPRVGRLRPSCPAGCEGRADQPWALGGNGVAVLWRATARPKKKEGILRSPPGLSFESGTPTWTRTKDQKIKSLLLYQLSYRGVVSCLAAGPEGCISIWPAQEEF